jgi:hypothetical protein
VSVCGDEYEILAIETDEVSVCGDNELVIVNSETDGVVAVFTVELPIV